MTILKEYDKSLSFERFLKGNFQVINIKIFRKIYSKYKFILIIAKFIIYLWYAFKSIIIIVRFLH